MTLLAELTAGFPWGVLLIADWLSTEPIPEWASPEDQVTSASTAMVMRVRHGDEGPVMVRVWSGGADAAGTPVHQGPLQVRSGVLRVSDAAGSEATDVNVAPGSRILTLFADEPSEATVVDVLVG